VRGKHDARVLADVDGQPVHGVAHVRHVRGNELRVVEPAVDERDVHVGRVIAQRLLRGSDVFAILLATRVGMVRRGDETDRAADAIRVHLLQVSVRYGCQLRIPM
jgi:predicted GNAT family N-acyltransferase